MFTIDRDDGNRDKCQKHGLSVAEIEFVLRSARVYLGPDVKHSNEETQSIIVGQTANSRYVFVAVTFRYRDDSLLIRPISARFMHRKEVRRYEQAISENDNGS
jgi:uncharacterized DUF497 family protein